MNWYLLRNVSVRLAMNQIRKDVIKVFKDVVFKVDLKTNLKKVNFLELNSKNLTNTIQIHWKTLTIVKKGQKLKVPEILFGSIHRLAETWSLTSRNAYLNW